MDYSVKPSTIAKLQGKWSRIRTDMSDGDRAWEEDFYILRKSWEDNLTVSHKLEPKWPDEVSPAEAMIAAYDVLSRIFGQAAVIMYPSLHNNNGSSIRIDKKRN